jgi:hypothetical protein
MQNYFYYFLMIFCGVCARQAISIIIPTPDLVIGPGSPAKLIFQGSFFPGN